MDRNSYVTSLKSKIVFVTSPGIPFLKLRNLHEFGNERNVICKLMDSESGLFQDPKAVSRSESQKYFISCLCLPFTLMSLNLIHHE